jgi:hypothetical protein
MDFSRIEVNLVVRLGRRKASAHEVVVVHYDWAATKQMQ